MKTARTLLFFLCQMAVALLCATSSDDSYTISVGLLATLTVELSLLCALLLWLPVGWSNAVRIIVSVVLYALALTDLYCQTNFGTPISPNIIAFVLQTDIREIIDFLSAFGFTLFRWNSVHFVVLIIFFHIVVSIWLGYTTFATNLWTKLKPKKRILIAVWLLLVVVCLPSAFSVKQQYVELLSQPTMNDMEGMVFRGYNQAANTPWWRLVYAIQGNRIATRDIELQKSTARHVTVDSCSFRSPSIVLIIGESYNRHHSQLYGYPLETTPRQVERRDSGQLFVFKDVVSPWNITSNAFTQMFSLYGYGAPGQWGDYPLFPQLFRRAGYQVAFLSNQFVRRWSGSGNQTGGFFLNDREVCDSLFTVRNRRKRQYDEGFLRQCCREHEVLSDTSLVIYHLMGQHFEYANRYPSKFARFTARDYRHRSLTAEQRRIVATYDNATRYNDLIVDRILQQYSGRPTIVVYLSDHGEECYDDLPVHGRLYTPLERRQVHQEFEIPFWIWCSPSYQTTHPEVVERIRAATQRPFMTDHLPHMLLWLAGISCPYYEASHDLLSPSFDTRRPRMLEGTVDYDALMRGK